MSMAMPEWLVLVLGITGIVCFMLMMVPQIHKNWRSQSTDGMSLALVVMWHVSAVLSTAYFAASPNNSVAVSLSFAVFAVCCGVCEAQVVAYRPSRTNEKNSCCVVLGVSSLLHAVSAAVACALFAAFRAMPADATYVVGLVLPSILLGAGFLPQMYEFISRRSVQGYSFGVTVFDLVGSSANTAVIFAPAGVSTQGALKESAPFLTIIAMHIVLLALAVLIKCCCSAGADTGSSKTVEVACAVAEC
mmetsp:Transcript_80125/g.203865  ORF Transcript_80125/g.203865 Transcript_80125/m.203865 type:complete len:247 (-) Transcript_80125:420-1160(-)